MSQTAYTCAFGLFLMALVGWIGFQLGKASVIKQCELGKVSHESMQWHCRQVPEWL